MDLDKAIKSRKSVRKFTSKKPDWRDIIECIDAARFSPTAGSNFILKFVLVDNKEKIQQIADACQQQFINEAHYVVVACSTPLRLVNSYGNDGRIYARQQAGAAIQNFLLKLGEKGLSTCWIGYFVERLIKEAIKVDSPKEINIEAVFPIGFDGEKKKTKKAKIELDRILYFNEFGEEQMKKIKKMDV